MDIQNYRAIDENGNTIDFPFKEWIEHPDTCVGFTIELFNSSDTVAVYRQIELRDATGCIGQWWWLDLKDNTITRCTGKTAKLLAFHEKYRII